MPRTRISGKSPSQTALSETDLVKKSLCDYIVNVADGCSHGCRFCYVPSTPGVRMDPGGKFADAGVENVREEWGEYSLYREDLPQNLADDCQRLEGDWDRSRRGQGVVGVSFHTDCYMDSRAAAITEWAVRVLAGHQRPARILTRNTKLAADLHGDLLGALGQQGLVTVGASIPTIREREVSVIERDAPPVEHRLTGLEALEEKGVPVYVSMSPTYPTHDKEAIRETMEAIKDRISPTVIFHEPINPRAGNLDACVEAAEDAGLNELAASLESIRNAAEWRQYAVRQLHWVQELGEEMALPVHVWPDDRLLDDSIPDGVREWCQAWRNRPSPEEIGQGPACDDAFPELTIEMGQTEQQHLGSY